VQLVRWRLQTSIRLGGKSNCVFEKPRQLNGSRGRFRGASAFGAPGGCAPFKLRTGTALRIGCGFIILQRKACEMIC
jgi:hypothetical protein